MEDPRCARVVAALTGIALSAGAAHAEDGKTTFSGKLLLMAGVATLEGSAGGGLVPWAVIGGNAIKNGKGTDHYRWAS